MVPQVPKSASEAEAGVEAEVESEATLVGPLALASAFVSGAEPPSGTGTAGRRGGCVVRKRFGRTASTSRHVS